MDRDLEETRRGIEQRIQSVDESGVESPDSRAERVFSYLRENDEFTNWDIMCFSVLFIRFMAPSMMWLAQPAKRLLRFLMNQHYVLTEQLANFEIPIQEFKKLNEEMEKDEE